MILTQLPPDASQLPPDIAPVVMQNGPPEWAAPVIVITTIAVVTGLVLLLRPLFQAWGRRIEGSVGDPVVTGELHALRERVAELEINAARMHELEERLDFAERLLSQRGEVARLPRDGGLS